MNLSIVRTITLLGVCLVLGGGSALAGVPDFALWSAKRSGQTDAALRAAWTSCQGKGLSDAGEGSCSTAALARTFIRLRRESRPLAVIFRGAPAHCMVAIRSYGSASSKYDAAEMIYFRTHAHVLASEIQGDINGEPYSTLRQVEKEAEARAIRICG